MKNYPLEIYKNLFKAVDLLDKLFQQAFVIATEVKLLKQFFLDHEPLDYSGPLMSADEMAGRLKVTKRTIDKWAQAGKLVPYPIGNRKYFKFGENPKI
ncbi:helix-turn-helix domain-containing protein [Arcticibacter eurypsychrophilus]|uniref:helix-turn-helix domain-containing protein n=1 Tax=Arcticibacter eurypsychrophilus TaxID=1434752 RepID=UPI00084E0842|nr:helix-turn-helix domain-containing protein [Arcticibacter eurypsychrophilus]